MTLDPTASEWLCPVCDRAYDAPGACDDDGATLLEIAAEAAEPAPTTLAGRFTVHERLSEGGMGAVYRATQTSMGRPVALKIMHGRLSQDAAAARRFIREARLASHIAHPNVVSVIDFGQDPDGTLFLAMELLAGPTLAELLAREGPFDAARTVRIGVQIADALDAAHKRGIIHRDLKPGNVIVVDPTPGRDALKVVDFGLAKATDGDHTTLTGPGQIFGTPAYMSPEMAAGYEVGAPADLYALGVILFELLDKRLPFDGDSVQSILLAHVSRPPPPLPDHVPAALAAVIKRLLAKEPAARYASAAAARDALAHALGSGPFALAAPGDAAPPPVAASAPAEDPGRAWLAVTRPAPTGQEHETVRPPGPRPGRRLLVALAGLAALAVVVWLATRDAAGPPPRPSEPAAVVAAGAGLATLPTAPPPPETAPAAEVDAASAAVVEVDAASATSAPGDDVIAAAPGEDAAPTVVLVRITLDAKPSAWVTVAGESHGRTPVTLDLPRGDAPIRVRFARKGYEAVVREVRPTGDATVAVTLEKEPGEDFIVPTP